MLARVRGRLSECCGVSDAVPPSILSLSDLGKAWEQGTEGSAARPANSAPCTNRLS